MNNNINFRFCLSFVSGFYLQILQVPWHFYIITPCICSLPFEGGSQVLAFSPYYDYDFVKEEGSPFIEGGEWNFCVLKPVKYNCLSLVPSMDRPIIVRVSARFSPAISRFLGYQLLTVFIFVSFII